MKSEYKSTPGAMLHIDLSSTRERTALWLGTLKLGDLPYYKEASASSGLKLDAPLFAAALRRPFPYPCLPMKVVAIVANGWPLSRIKSFLIDAAERDDFEFFAQLGDLIQHKKSKKGNVIINLSDKFPNQMLMCWTEGLLWLMTDKAGVQYFKLDNINVTEDAYKKTRSRLKLFKHPEAPIIGITTNEIDAPGKPRQRSGPIMKAKPDILLSLILRNGWKLSGAGLIKLSRGHSAKIS